jgi:flagellar protein FliO/FliZ
MMNKMVLLLAACSVMGVQAADSTRPAYTPPSVLTLESVLQVVFSLLLVLGIVALVAWLLKRVSLPQQSAGRQLKVISNLAVGQRERVVVVEIQETWLVLGVAPGQVQTLHTLPRQGSEPRHGA